MNKKIKQIKVREIASHGLLCILNIMIHFFFFASDMQNMQIIQQTTASSAMIF